MAQPLPEVWLRGPVDGVPPLLQPAAHALLQAVEELQALMADFPDDLLWQKPAGCASVGFHLLHIAGVLNRLCTYAAGRPLSSGQLQYLAEETVPQPLSAAQLLQGVEMQVHDTLEKFKTIPEAGLTEPRSVGRMGLPSTVLGLLFHAAEHTMRHVGQMVVTVAVVTATTRQQSVFM